MHYYMSRNKAPKSMPKRETEALLAELKELRQMATLERAEFFAFDKESEKKNAELKERTRLYRQSWLIAPLDALIERYSEVLKDQ